MNAIRNGFGADVGRFDEESVRWNVRCNRPNAIGWNVPCNRSNGDTSPEVMP